MFLAVVLTAFVLAANFTFAQNNDQKKDCKSKCGTNINHENKTECTTKHGTSEGTLDTAKLLCPVSGETIDGTEGTPIKFTYLGKEYNFCCGGCVKKFKAEPIKYIKTEMLCPVMGETVDKEVSTIVDGVKYYFCCPSCIKKFERDPQKYLERLNNQN